ncbi:MAG: nitrilase-related carbon-nitrogen hydrolase [Archaeoglobaceae archaeon]|nr:carbon-nitrogen family hydrolase [Archaeoglobaceae archaeon]MDW7989168.1 nitrilase-related carbon-nitrogen hydrolase [Archaeoglobaceae archaeon]
MSISKIRIALAQQRISADRDLNLMKGLSLIKRALQVRANLVILPELFNTGFYEKNLISVKELEKELDIILRLSKDKEIFIIAGVAEKCDRLYNSAVIIHRGEILGIYRKNLLFPLTKEKQIFASGGRLEVFDTSVGKIGILICYEIRFPELARKLVKKGAELIAIPAEFPKQRIEHWKTLLKARAIENQVFVAGVNCVEGDLGYGGNSMLVDPEGKVLVEGGIYQEILMSDIDLSEVEAVREKYPFLKDYESLDFTS